MVETFLTIGVIVVFADLNDRLSEYIRNRKH
jgi:hypothetical protein